MSAGNTMSRQTGTSPQFQSPCFLLELAGARLHRADVSIAIAIASSSIAHSIEAGVRMRAAL